MQGRSSERKRARSDGRGMEFTGGRGLYFYNAAFWWRTERVWILFKQSIPQYPSASLCYGARFGTRGYIYCPSYRRPAGRICRNHCQNARRHILGDRYSRRERAYRLFAYPFRPSNDFLAWVWGG